MRVRFGSTRQITGSKLQRNESRVKSKLTSGRQPTFANLRNVRKLRMFMDDRETLLAFIRSINAHDVEGLGELMSEGHVFIDAHGNEVQGRKKMIAGWRGYFEWFPDYWIEVKEVFASETLEGAQTFAMFGLAGGSFKGNSGASWRLPAAWKAIVKDGRVVLWQVFADTKIPFEAIEGNRGG